MHLIITTYIIYTCICIYNIYIIILRLPFSQSWMAEGCLPFSRTPTDISLYLFFKRTGEDKKRKLQGAGSCDGFTEVFLGPHIFPLQLWSWACREKNGQAQIWLVGILLPGTYWISFKYLITCFILPHSWNLACVSKARMWKSSPRCDLNKQKAKGYQLPSPCFTPGKTSDKSERQNLIDYQVPKER